MRSTTTRREFLVASALGSVGLATVALSQRSFADNGCGQVQLPLIRTITHGPKFHWFGYYDKRQFDPTGRYALGIEIEFENRSPQPDDAVKVGMVDLQDGDRWIELGESRAWCWQQGCMLQWRPGSDREVIWNDCCDGRFVCQILNVKTKQRRTIPHPIYAISPDGRWAVAPDFSRLADLRPGYGYAGVPDPFANQSAPGKIGVFHVDLETGEQRLIIPLAEVAKIPLIDGANVPDSQRNLTQATHWFNHLLVNTDGSRFAFLHRWRMKGQRLYTRMITARPDGSDLRIVDPLGHTSHFIWRDPAHILAWSWHPSHGERFYLFEDRADGAVELVGGDVMTENGHCSYLPGNEWILNDTYPDHERQQHVYLYHVATGRRVPLGDFRSPAEYEGEWRCDTHPRFSPNGRSVIIDSPHTGIGRQMHLIDISDVVGQLPRVTAKQTNESPALRFARELAKGYAIVATVRHDGSDAYRFHLTDSGAIEVESGSDRGVLYAVYDVLFGKKSGDATPAFSVRGLYPCEAYQRMTPDMMRRQIDRMGRWRMNTLPVITDYGYRDLANVIEEECAKRGIDVVHYAYCQLAFSQGIPRDCFSVDRQGKPKPPYDRLENQDRLCASNPKALDLFRQGVRKYLRDNPDRRRLLFATADGLDYCECEGCRHLGPVGQAMPFFNIFMEEIEGRGLWREFLVYFQRYQFPDDMTQVRKTDAIMFDIHTRNPMWPLHDPDNKAGEDSAHPGVDPRAKGATSNRYLFDRLLEWRAAYPGKLYIHENVMIQGSFSMPRFNTRVYLEDLRQFQKAKIDGVVYEAFECGIRPYVPMFDVLARALWDPTAQYDVRDDTYPELHEFYRLVAEFQRQGDWVSCRNLMTYLLARPDRDEFDWLFIGYHSMKVAYGHQPLANLTEEERELITTRKLWDYMEGRKDSRRVVGQLLEQITGKLNGMSAEELQPAAQPDVDKK